MSTVELDPGDLGVVWVEGVGFRPVDGIDEYGAGKADCTVIIVYKDMAEDKIEKVQSCDDGPSLWTEKWTPPPELWTPPAYAPPVYYVPPLYASPPSSHWAPPIYYGGGDCCSTTYPPDTPPPVVPLPSSAWLLIAALILSWMLCPKPSQR